MWCVLSCWFRCVILEASISECSGWRFQFLFSFGIIPLGNVKYRTVDCSLAYFIPTANTWPDLLLQANRCIPGIMPNDSLLRQSLRMSAYRRKCRNSAQLSCLCSIVFGLQQFYYLFYEHTAHGRRATRGTELLNNVQL